MNAIQRADQDVKRGDHWLARQRLESYLLSKGYDQELLVKIGQVAYEMHDAYNAGRMWFASPAEGEDVDRAIDAFLRCAGRDARQVANQLPRAVRDTKLEEYPTIVQDRFRQLGLDVVFAARATDAESCSGGGPWVKRLVQTCVVIVVLFFVTSCWLGVARIMRWVFGEE